MSSSPLPCPSPSPPPYTHKYPQTDISLSKPVEKARVTFDYEADNEDELTIKVGEIVEIVNRNTENDGWWEVGVMLLYCGYLSYFSCRGMLVSP